MNDLERLHRYLLSFPFTTEEFPFGPQAAVYKVAGKLFSILTPDDVPPRMNLKCDPNLAIEIRSEYDAILPGYHQNKKHWNTLLLDGSLDDDFVEELIAHSFSLVVKGHTREVRDKIAKTELPRSIETGFS